MKKKIDTIVGKAALLIIDVTKGSLLPPEKTPIPIFDAQTAVDNIGKVLETARQAGIPVIFFQELHRVDLIDFGRELEGVEDIHCLEGSEDVEFLDYLKPARGEYAIGKRRYSCFFSTDLNILLKGLKVETLLVTGFLTDVCVHYTCADAHQHDYYVRVLHDCVRGSSPEAHQASLNAIEYLQTASKTNSSEIIALLEQRVTV
ncbi:MULTISPECIES: cysteine hydrolase family protein [Paenibacillus]|uniref:Cysteine hydrolase n=1 Tax=Paenibacillus lignilyticus TaxID=1172615 RepID=A0ABS5CJE1_9BACL|nr:MULTISPECIES: isochorismatase family cysteine hydrolase [Paenibacillus]MBP3965986.1 cysteine hydrolase [Paenibacillus lignilyticus]SFT26601.1 Nicotinamidase-related amidase [Paenibacillus sp. BC26]